MVELKGKIVNFSKESRKAANGKFERGIQIENERSNHAGMWYNLQHGDANILNKQVDGLQKGDVVAVVLSQSDQKLIESFVVVQKAVLQPKSVQDSHSVQKPKPVVQTPFQHAQLPPPKKSVAALYAFEVDEVLGLLERNPKIGQFQKAGVLAPVDLNAAVFTRIKLKMERGEK